jgi:serine/threonine protein kinase
LKPSNCFIDDAGVVKVGDFGLSRESGDMEDSNVAWLGGVVGGDNDNTVGVGTRSYASPEQLKGSDYGPSTDVYSLGIMLFELCYPMYTASRRSLRCTS